MNQEQGGFRGLNLLGDKLADNGKISTTKIVEKLSYGQLLFCSEAISRWYSISCKVCPYTADKLIHTILFT